MERSAHLAFDLFCRRLRAACRAAYARRQAEISEKMSDAQLFATTFGAGFLFVTLFVA